MSSRSDRRGRSLDDGDLSLAQARHPDARAGQAWFVVTQRGQLTAYCCYIKEVAEHSIPQPSTAPDDAAEDAGTRDQAPSARPYAIRPRQPSGAPSAGVHAHKAHPGHHSGGAPRPGRWPCCGRPGRGGTLCARCGGSDWIRRGSSSFIAPSKTTESAAGRVQRPSTCMLWWTM